MKKPKLEYKFNAKSLLDVHPVRMYSKKLRNLQSIFFGSRFLSSFYTSPKSITISKSYKVTTSTNAFKTHYETIFSILLRKLVNVCISLRWGDANQFIRSVKLLKWFNVTHA